MRRISHVLILAAFVAFLMLPMGVGDQATPLRSDANGLLLLDNGRYQVAGGQDSADWWNSTYVYRRYYNFTEPDVTSRTLTPVHLSLSFSDDHCHRDSIRVGYYDAPGWSMLPFQLWNTTYDSTGNYIESTRVSFMVNVSQGQTESNYYIYYAKIDVGSVSYPDFYPFIYKSYTFSLLNLVSYYDDNNYFIEMWDGSLSQWDDPRNLDARWAGTSGSVVPSDVPSGTLDKFEYAQYEPNSYSYTLFHGYYAVYSNYPLAVTMGQGNVGSNPAINDWYPGVNQLSSGIGTEFILGGVEGFESRNEGKYWVQAIQNNTEVYVWTSGDVADTGWKFSGNNSLVTFPAVLKAGEYVSKRDVVYTTYMKVNSTKPVSVHQGDSDCSYARDIWAFYSTITGALAGEEFYTIDMGNSYDRTRVTNLGDTTIQVDWWRDSGSGWGTKSTLTINANSSQLISPGTASSSNQEDVLHIKGPVDSMLMVEGVYNPGAAIDAGDWVPTITGHRFGTNLKLWGRSGYKFMIVATENAIVNITGYNDGQLEIPAGGMAAFRPLSSSATLYHITSNASVGVVDLGRFSTSSPYNPTADTGYGWQVPAYVPEQDQKGFSIDLGEERHLFEFDITVVDLDDVVVSSATVTLYNASTHAIWEDEQFNNRTGTTDGNGLIVFEGLSNGTYEVRTRIDAAPWLTTSFSNVWVMNTSDHPITGSVTPIEIVLPMASIDVLLRDKMDQAMLDTDTEDTYFRASNISDVWSSYIHQAKTNASGYAHFPRMPMDDYSFYASYAGPDGWSYIYSDIMKFANWSLTSTDFAGGSFSLQWYMPLVTIEMHVHSWDDMVVEGATVRINNTIDEDQYQITKTTDADGNYTFYRVVNGTWKFNVWKHDAYPHTPEARNNTQLVVDLDGYYPVQINLPLSRLKIHVETATGDNINGASVNITLVSSGLVVQGVTDGQGDVVFLNIHTNISTGYPYNIYYTVRIVKGTRVHDNETYLRCLRFDDYSNFFIMEDPAYPAWYTEMNSTDYYLDVRWGRNASILVGYYYINDTGSYAVDLDSSSWVNFTVYLGTTPVGSGSWNWTCNSGWIHNKTDYEFNITISPSFWLLHVSDTPYTIRMNAHTDTYLDPSEIVVYLTVKPALTAEGNGSSSISEYYKTHSSHLFWLADLTNGVNATTLDTYNYIIKLGATPIRWGTLSVNPDDTYDLPSTALHGLDVGSYTLIVTLEKKNYVNQTIVLDVAIGEVPMQVAAILVSNYDWALAGRDYTFEYNFNLPGNSSSPSSDLTGITVIIQWLTDGGVSYLNVTRVFSASSGTITYSFTRDIVPVGNWNLTITCSKDNYQLATGTIGTFIQVSDAPTALAVVGPSTATEDWLTLVPFEVDFTRNIDAAGLSGASFSHNWSDIVTLEDYGDGTYGVTVSTLVEADTYILRLTLSFANHEDSYVDLTITILVPLLIETEFGSIESPLEAYWTSTFDIEIILKDQSRGNEPVDGASVTYDWYVEFVVDQDGPLAGHLGGIYNISLSAFDALPQTDLYTIIITATKAGSTQDVTTIFVRINAVPNEIVLETEYFEAFYADVFDVRFYWNNTLDNATIDYADVEEYYLLTLGKSIATGVNEGGGWYHFTVDTMDLGMNANVQGSVYVIRITMTRSGFQAHELTAVIVLVRETDASLVIDAIGNVNWSDSFQITASLYDAQPDHGHMLIWDSAVVTVSYGTMSTLMTNNGNGTFSATIQSEMWFSASSNPYNLTFTYTLPNYVDNVNMSAVVIVPIPGSIVRAAPTGTPLEYTWGTSFELKVHVYNIYEGASESLVDAAVFYLWSSYDSQYPLVYRSGVFYYNVSVLTTQVPSGSYYLIVRVVNENLTIPDLEVPITVAPVGTTLESDTDRINVIQGVDETTTVTLTYLDEQSTPLDDATVYYEWAGLMRYGSYSSGVFVCEFNPSGSSLTVPGTYDLTFYAELQNYTSMVFNVTLVLNAATEMRADDAILESDQSLTLYFVFWDLTNDAEVPTGIVTSVGVILPGSTQVIPAVGHDTNGYYVILTASQIGEIRTDGYDIILVGIAPGYQNHTQSVNLQSVEVTIIEPQVFIPLLSNFIGSIPRSMLILTGFLVAIFGVLVGGTVAIRRWRVPFLIKQINKALKSVESGKRAKVENIKTMGGVISDVLAPGLAALDITAPIIDEVTEDLAEEILGEDTEELLGELDALDEIGADEIEALEETPDFEAELAAEIETVTEEAPEPEELVEPPAEVDEPDAELEEVLEEPKPESEETEAAVEEPEVEDLEPATEEISEDIEEELAPEDLPKEDELLESELETPAEEEVEPELESIEPESRKQLTKRELIEQLPSDVKESMSEEEIRKLSKKELLALIDSTEESDTSE